MQLSYICLTNLIRITRMTATTEAVNVRLPKEVAQILNTLVKRQLFSNRSEAIREFCRDYLVDAAQQRATTRQTGKGGNR